MNPRERKIAIVIGAALGAWMLYQGVSRLVIAPVSAAVEELETLEGQVASLQRERDALTDLAKQWHQLARRTYSFDERETVNAFGEELKRLASRHKLSGVRFQPRSGNKLPKTDITTLSFLVVAEGGLTDVAGFLRDFYRLPTLSKIRRLRLSPRNPVGGSDEIRIDELVVDTLVLPTFEAVEPVKQLVRGATTLPSDPAFVPSSLRVGLPGDPEFALLGERNVFKAYEPPPKFVIQVDNQDREPVEVTAKFTWKGEITGQPSTRVAGKSKQDMTGGEGDGVEITARYADGKTHGPQKLAYVSSKAVVFTVPSHTPPPPPTRFSYKIRNDDAGDAEVTVTLVNSGKSMTLPAMNVQSRKSIDLPELEGQRLTIAAVYADGSAAPQGVYEVSRQSTGTYVIPPKGEAPRPPPPPLPKANPDLQVTGLLSYPGAGELIALNTKTKKREIFELGQEMDGGKLASVNPLGGIVRMPGDVFYLYPLGRRFEERVELSARSEHEVPAAIEEWNQR